MKRAIQWLPILIGITFLLLLAYPHRSRILTGQNDFTSFYTGAQLAGTPQLYSKPANIGHIRSLHGFSFERMTYIRPPYYAAILKPMTSLPFLTAYAAFTALSIASILWFVIRFAKECPPLPVLASFGVPFVATLSVGQDTTFLLVAVGLAILLLRSRKNFAAGLILSLCSIKLHLFLFIPLLLVIKRRWGVLAGGLCGGVLLATMGLLVNDAASYQAWVETLKDPWINAVASEMPNLHGLVADLNGSVWIEWALVALVCAVFFWISTQSENFEFLFAVALVCGLLVSYHSAVVDDVLLFPVFVLIFGSSSFQPLRILTALLLTPVPYLVLMGQLHPFCAMLSIGLILFLAAAVIEARRAQTPSSTNRPLMANPA